VAQDREFLVIMKTIIKIQSIYKHRIARSFEFEEL
jgi:hypothetical protein